MITKPLPSIMNHERVASEPKSQRERNMLISQAWAASHKLFEKFDVLSVVRRLRFMASFLLHRDQLERQFGATGPVRLRTVLAARPELLQVLIWPYIHARWSVGQRIDAIATHYQFEQVLGFPILGVEDQRVLADLDAILPTAKLVLERPHWLMREGELTLSFFQEETRIYTLSFSLGLNQGRPAFFIGGIQGGNGENSLRLYAESTKRMHGLRPRDLMVQCLQMLAESYRVDCIRGVSDAAHHCHGFFGGKKKNIVFRSYDEVWTDRGGSPGQDGFFSVPAVRKPYVLADVPSKKRAMYRRRELLLESVQASMSDVLQGRPPHALSA